MRKRKAALVGLQYGVMLLVLLLAQPGATSYQGFDCGQGSAKLALSHHQHCHPDTKLECFRDMYFVVRNCTIKAYPAPRPTSGACKGVRVTANVTNINAAAGALSGSITTSGVRQRTAASLAWRRPQELMSLRFGPCQLLFNVSSANSSSFPPPEEDPKDGPQQLPSHWALPLLLAPLAAATCLVVAVSLAGSRLVPRHHRSGGAGAELVVPLLPEAGAYGGPGDSSRSWLDTASVLWGSALQQHRSSSSSNAGGGSSRRHHHGSHLVHGGHLLPPLLGVARRGKRPRRGRAARPVYIGMPGLGGADAMLAYAAGSIRCAQGRVAPLFRYAPVAAPPALPVIPEASSEDGPSPEPAGPMQPGATAAAAGWSPQPTGMLAAARRWLHGGSRAAGDGDAGGQSSSLQGGGCRGSSCSVRNRLGGFDPHCSV